MVTPFCSPPALLVVCWLFVWRRGARGQGREGARAGRERGERGARGEARLVGDVFFALPNTNSHSAPRHGRQEETHTRRAHMKNNNENNENNNTRDAQAKDQSKAQQCRANNTTTGEEEEEEGRGQSPSLPLLPPACPAGDWTLFDAATRVVPR